MIHVDVFGRQLKIMFRHDKPRECDTCKDTPQSHIATEFVDNPDDPDGDMLEVIGATECVILEGPRENEVMLARAITYCHYGDQWNKETGRQRALKRAVKSLNREVAGKLLAAYYTRHKTAPKRVEFAQDTY